MVQIIGPHKILDGGSSGFRLRFDDDRNYSLKVVNESVVTFGSWEKSRWNRGYRSKISQYRHWENTAIIRLDSPLAFKLASVVLHFKDHTADQEMVWYADWIIAKMSWITFDQAPDVAWGHFVH